MQKPSTPAIWASNKTFSFTPNAQQIAQGFDYIATIGRPEGAPITDDHDWPFNQVTTALKWAMDQLPEVGIQQLIESLLPKRSFSNNDFIRIPDRPGGLIVQWVSATNTNNVGAGYSSVNFPTLFPTKCFAIVASPYTSAGSSYGVGFALVDEAFTTSSFKWVARTAAGAAAPAGTITISAIMVGV